MDILPAIHEQSNNLALADLTPLDHNPAAVYLAGLSSMRSRDTMRADLGIIADFLFPDRFPQPERPKAPGAKASPEEREAYAKLKSSFDLENSAYKSRCFLIEWHDLRYAHAQAIRSKLAEAYAPATANRMLSALRGVLEAAWRLGKMSAEDQRRAADVKPVTGSTLPAGRELSPGEISALMAACENDPSPAGVRDGALIAVLYTCGLRREEAVSLDLADYDQESGRLILTGKRNKQRSAYLVNGTARAMADWLKIRGDEPGALFLPINKGNKIQNHRMQNQSIYNMLAKRGAEAGVKSFSPHDLRRTFVSDLLDAGADIATVSKMAGHSNVTTTARYDRRPEQAKQKAAGLLHLPYRGRML